MTPQTTKTILANDARLERLHFSIPGKFAPPTEEDHDIQDRVTEQLAYILSGLAARLAGQDGGSIHFATPLEWQGSGWGCYIEFSFPLHNSMARDKTIPSCLSWKRFFSYAAFDVLATAETFGHFIEEELAKGVALQDALSAYAEAEHPTI